MLLYVDDILIISNSKVIISGVKRDLKMHFEMKDLGSAKKILGIVIHKNRKKKLMWLSQSNYVYKVLIRFQMTNSKPAVIPLGGHLELSKKQCPSSQSEIQKMSKIPYDVAVGSVIYAMLYTRSDLAFAISVLSRFMSNPGEPH